MKYDCIINVEVKINPQNPIDTATALRIQSIETYLKCKIGYRLKKIEDEINEHLNKERFLRDDELISFRIDI
jgi:hypothetical protein